MLIRGDLNFITYWGEGFKGGKSDILNKFYLKYPQTDLTKEEKKKIFIYINEINGDKKEIIKNIYGSIQILIFYLTKNNFKADEEIKIILNYFPDSLNINKNLFNFFGYKGNNFNVNKLMNILFYFENLCFDDLVKILSC